MPLHQLEQATGLLYQSTGNTQAPPIVYLPGVHGDWTPQVRARPLLSREFWLIETAYPRIDHWSINDFSRSLKQLLDRLGIGRRFLATTEIRRSGISSECLANIAYRLVGSRNRRLCGRSIGDRRASRIIRFRRLSSGPHIAGPAGDGKSDEDHPAI